MYHYYVRYSYFNKSKEKIGEGCSEIKSNKKISELSHIYLFADTITKEIKESFNSEAEYSIIDFYQLLRKEDPD